MLVSCQLGETWCATLSSFAIRIPVAPTTRAFHFMVLELSENGDSDDAEFVLADGLDRRSQ